MSNEKARELSRKLNVLFWVGVIIAVVDLIKSDSLVSAVCGIIYAVLLIMMGRLNGFYKKSGVIVFISMGVTVIWLVVTTAALFTYGIGAMGIYMAILVTIAIAVAGYICVGIGMVMLFIVPALGTIASLAGGIIMFVIGIVKIVYIYKTMAVFRDYNGPVFASEACGQQGQDFGETSSASQTSYVYAEPVREPGAEADTGEKGDERDGGNGENNQQ